MAEEDTRECEAMRKMFCGGLNRDTTEDTFFGYFGEFGNMVDQVIIKDPTTHTSRGFGFITYDSSKSVEDVFNARPHVIDGKTIDVKRAMPKEYNTTTAHSKVTKLFIGGIGPDLTPEELQDYIDSRHSGTGTVEKIDLIKDRETNKNKGFGFMECSSADFADRLTISEHEFTLKGRQMGLKKAEPKGEVGGAGPDRGRGGRGGFSSRGGSRGRGASGGRGGGRGGSYGGQDNGYNSGYSTGYPGQYGGAGGYNNYQQSQPAGGNYGGYGGGYGANQGQVQGRGGWNNGGGNRYQPY